MEKKSLAPYGIVIFMMILTSLALAFTVDVNLSGEVGIKFAKDDNGTEIMYLPDQVGDWTGERILFCQNPNCGKDWKVSELQDLTICPECGSRLDGMTMEEKDALPLDTEMVKKQYSRGGEDGERLFVNIVLSGKSRSSIHRPQRCLIAQGSTIERVSTMSVPTEDNKTMNVKLINNVYHTKSTDTSMPDMAFKRYFIYWFIGHGRETESHVKRMIYMAVDRIFHNSAHRWAYISISAPPISDNSTEKEDLAVLKEFIGKLHPQIIRKDI